MTKHFTYKPVGFAAQKSALISLTVSSTTWIYTEDAEAIPPVLTAWWRVCLPGKYTSGQKVSNVMAATLVLVSWPMQLQHVMLRWAKRSDILCYDIGKPWERTVFPRLSAC